MSQHHREHASVQPTPDEKDEKSARRRLGFRLAAVVVAIVVVGALSLSRREKSDQKGAPVAAEPPSAEQTSARDEPAATADSERKDGLKTLEGKWLRADGGYVVEVRRVASDGKLEVGYFNPSPIHVAKARAATDHGLIRVFLELRDQGYPGCTYELTYDRGNDCLAGTYFQAAMGQTYDVVFTRLRP